MNKTWYMVFVPGILVHRAVSALPTPPELSVSENRHILYNYRIARKG